MEPMDSPPPQPPVPSASADPCGSGAPRCRVLTAAAALLVLLAAVLFAFSGPGRALLAKAFPRHPAPAPTYLVGEWGSPGPGLSPTMALGRLSPIALDLRITSAGQVSGKVAGAVLREARISAWSRIDALLYKESFEHRIDALLEGAIDGKPYRADVMIAARPATGPLSTAWAARVFLRRDELGLGGSGRIPSPLLPVQRIAPGAKKASPAPRSRRPAPPTGPPLVVKRLPKLTLTTHKYVLTSHSVQYRVAMRGGETERPAGASHTGPEGESWLRVDGTDYYSGTGMGSLPNKDSGPSAWGAAFDNWMRDEAGVRLSLAPGRHRVAYVFRPDNAVLKGWFSATPLPEIVSSEAEFTVVPAFPPDYRQPAFEPGWDKLLREKMTEIRYGSSAHSVDPKEVQDGAFLSFSFLSGMPFDLAAQVFLEAESDPGRRIAAGWLTRERTDHGSRTMMYGNSMILRGVDLLAMEGKRWRVILVPSQDVAMSDPDIRHYYGREFVSDWGFLRADEDWARQRIKAICAMSLGAPLTEDHGYGYILSERVVHYEFDRGGSMTGPPSASSGADLDGLPTRDGGGVRVNLAAGARLLPLPDAIDAIDATLKARARRAELKASTADRLPPAPGKAVYAAVLTDRGALFVLQIEADRDLQEKWWRWRADDAPKP